MTSLILVYQIYESCLRFHALHFIQFHSDIIVISDRGMQYSIFIFSYCYLVCMSYNCNLLLLTYLFIMHTHRGRQQFISHNRILILLSSMLIMHTQRQAAGLKIIEGSCAAGEHDSCYLAGTHYISPGTHIMHITLLLLHSVLFSC